MSLIDDGRNPGPLFPRSGTRMEPWPESWRPQPHRRATAEYWDAVTATWRPCPALPGPRSAPDDAGA